jgi:hypothetical protein
MVYAGLVIKPSKKLLCCFFFFFALCRFLALFTLQPGRWRRYISPKSRLISKGLHSILSSKIESLNNYVRFETLKSFTMKTIVVRDVTPYSPTEDLKKLEELLFFSECSNVFALLGLFFRHESGGSTFLRNFCKLLQGYKMSHPRRKNCSRNIYSKNRCF